MEREKIRCAARWICIIAICSQKISRPLSKLLVLWLDRNCAPTLIIDLHRHLKQIHVSFIFHIKAHRSGAFVHARTREANVEIEEKKGKKKRETMQLQVVSYVLTYSSRFLCASVGSGRFTEIVQLGGGGGASDDSIGINIICTASTQEGLPRQQPARPSGVH